MIAFLDYCNTLPSGLYKKSLSQLQYYRIQPHECWRGPEGGSTSHQFEEVLHCLIVWSILVFKSLNGVGLFLLFWPTFTISVSQNLRSYGTGLFTIPQVRSETHREAAFSYRNTQLWKTSRLQTLMKILLLILFYQFIYMFDLHALCPFFRLLFRSF